MNIKKNIIILVASMTGNALMCAEEIAEFCENNNIYAKIEELEYSDIDEIIESREPLLICSSTYGQGDIPDPGQNFYKKLKEKAPDLSHINYALFGLGDMTYKDTFASGGKKFDELFLSLKAKPLVKPYYHDASEGTLPEEEAVKWFKKNIYDIIR